MTDQDAIDKAGALYLRGASYSEVADQMGVSWATAYRLVTRAGVKLTDAERADRRGRSFRRINASGLRPVKRRVFENAPDKREEYLLLRKAMGAAYARQAMGIAA